MQLSWLKFLSRLSFICGILFLASVSLLIKNWLTDEVAISTIVTIGYAMGMILFPLVNLCYLFVFIVKRKLRVYVPLWLILSNILFLLALIFFIFYLNDPAYHQK
jgi:hypothetical protein